MFGKLQLENDIIKQLNVDDMERDWCKLIRLALSEKSLSLG
jgi:hypothetical protein